MITLKDAKTHFIAHLILYYTFIVGGLVINLLELLTYIFIWPFNKHLYRKIIYYLGLSIYSSNNLEILDKIKLYILSYTH